MYYKCHCEEDIVRRGNAHSICEIPTLSSFARNDVVWETPYISL